MSDQLVSRDTALENVLIMAERLAFLHYAFAKTLEEELGQEEAEGLVQRAILEYGRLAAESAQKKLSQQGLKPTLKNFRYGKDLPSMGWKGAPIQLPPEHPLGKISKITYCPLAEAWKGLGEEGKRLGRMYCRVDQAKYLAYGKGYRCFHDQNTLDGDDCCVIRVELEKPEE